MSRAIALGVMLLIAAPCFAEDFDVDELYEKWKTEENRTLEGWRVLDDNTLIEKLWSRRAQRPSHDRRTRRNMLLAVMHRRGVGGAPQDALRVRRYTGFENPADDDDQYYMELLISSWVDASEGHLTVQVAAETDGTGLAAHDRLKDARKSGSPAVRFLSAMVVANAGVNPNNVSDVVAALDLSARSGCLPAMVELARMLTSHPEVARDSEAAIDWLLKARESNYLPAIIELGRFYHIYAGQRPDLVKCKQYFTEAAEIGSLIALEEIERLPEIPLEELDVSTLYSMYLKGFNSFDSTRDSRDRNEYALLGRNRALSRYPEIEAWLQKRIDPPKSEGVLQDEINKARVMYADVLLNRSDVRESRIDDACNWSYDAAVNTDEGAAKLIYALALARNGEEHRAGVYLRRAVATGFDPAKRVQALVVLRERQDDFTGFLNGNMILWDVEEEDAVERLQQLAAKGDPDAARSMHEYYADLLREAPRSREWIETAASHGSAFASLLLAKSYKTGWYLGVEPNVELAELYFRQCLKFAATYKEAKAYFTGRALDDEVARAEELGAEAQKSVEKWASLDRFLEANPYFAGIAQKADTRGSNAGKALYAIAMLYGHGISFNEEEAQARLVELGDDPLCSFLLGTMMEEGLGSYKRDERGAKWIYASVLGAGGAYAGYRLGRIYAQQTSKYHDVDKAFKHFLEAAEAGCVPAMTVTAIGYRNGDGTEVDNAKAKEWAKKAADAGDEGASKLLEQWE